MTISDFDRWLKKGKVIASFAIKNRHSYVFDSDKCSTYPLEKHSRCTVNTSELWKYELVFQSNNRYSYVFDSDKCSTYPLEKHDVL